MNKLQSLIDNGIEISTAINMLSSYQKRIGKKNGMYEITDINYDFSLRCKVVTLKCSYCGKVIYRNMVNGKNKWSELIKTCECKKGRKKEEFEKNKKIKKDNMFIDAKSMVGKDYGDYKISWVENNNDMPVLALKCRECGYLVLAPYQSIKSNTKKYSTCHKHYKQMIKYDESYIGRKNNYLSVIDITRDENGDRTFLCICDCGNIKMVKPTYWENGKVKSCGCKHDELCSEKSTIHGHSGDRLYRVWANMKGRCYNKNSDNYNNYGGRGIIVCQEWLDDFMNFHDWAMENGYDYDAPFGECTIDRIDVNGNYEPSNCRWADVIMQANNKRPRKLKTWTINGTTKTRQEWCSEYSTSVERVKYRVEQKGMTALQALEDSKGSVIE